MSIEDIAAKKARITKDEAAKRAKAGLYQTRREEEKILFYQMEMQYSQGQAVAVALDDLIETVVKDFFIRHRDIINEVTPNEWSLFREWFDKEGVQSGLIKSLSDADLLDEMLPDNYTAKTAVLGEDD